MSGWLTLFRREMGGYLLSPIAAIVGIAFLLLGGGLFMSQFFLLKVLDMRGFFDLMPWLLAVMLPAVSMRLWAEDRQLNTLELLLSLPLKPTALVLGKYLAAVSFFALMLASTWTIPMLLRLLGQPDLGPIASGYLGTLLVGALFLAIGQFVSGLCRDQIVAFIVGLFACLGLFLVGTELIASVLDGWWPGLGGLLQQHLGIAQHIVGFQKGVIDGRDVAYLVILSAAFLALNGVWMEGRLRPKARLAFTVACALGLGIAVAAHGVLQQLPLGRVDCTANRAYTVSPVTRQLLRGLEVPVTVKLYFSPPEKMPTAMRTLERDLRDTLEELRLASSGKLRYTVSHLEASLALSDSGADLAGQDSPAATARGGGATAPVGPQAALGSRGIRPFQVQSIESDELGVRLIYAAAAIAYKDRSEEVIPQLVLESLDQFEYLVMSKIHRLTLDDPPQVAILAPFQQKELDPNMLGLLQQLGMNPDEQLVQDEYRYLQAILRHEGYPVRRIRLTEQDPIPAGTRTLVIADPGRMSDRQCYEVNRFLVEGGSVFLASQRYRFEYRQTGGEIQASPVEQPIELDPLLASWGLAISRDLLLDEESTILSVSGGAMVGPFSVSVPVKAPVHVVVNQAQMNAQLSITSQLPPLLYLWGSPLVLKPETLKTHGLAATTLFTSSPRSWVVPLAEYDRFSMAQPTSGRFPLAVWVTGTFPDAYAGQPVPAWETQEPPKLEPPISALTPKPGQLIVVGCSEMFKEHLARAEGHLVFLTNTVDTLASGGKLVGIRNKRPLTRLLTTPSAGAKTWARFLTLGLMPAVIVGLSLAHAAWRRRLRQAEAAPRPSSGRASVGPTDGCRP